MRSPEIGVIVVMGAEDGRHIPYGIRGQLRIGHSTRPVLWLLYTTSLLPTNVEVFV